MSGIVAVVGTLLVWLMATVWEAQTNKLTEIASSSESTAHSMRELVILVREDRVRIINLESRVNKIEDKMTVQEARVRDFWQNYNPPKK